MQGGIGTAANIITVNEQSQSNLDFGVKVFINWTETFHHGIQVLTISLIYS